MPDRSEKLYDAALRYHEKEPAGKWAMTATKPLETQRDLSLAYSPGVAAACEKIRDDSDAAARLTARGNLVAVVSNGTAVLGLGAIGPLASKPVMEGKAVLFKKFAHIDCVDIEVDATEPEHFCQVVEALEPSFGAINLEDIKAPECFVIEKRLREQMNIPVMHDDQHGTAIVAGAAVYNALRLVKKKFEDVKIVSTGGGAAGLACLDLLVHLGARKENIFLFDVHGLVHESRKTGMDEYRARYAQKKDVGALEDVIDGADVFLGLSAPDILSAESVRRMAENPLILALANPRPEIMPDVARKARPDAIVATGRSDFPNQVNNVICFPFIFRGALDVGATVINEEMKVACVKAIAALTEAEVSDVVSRAYEGESLKLGPDYILPKPFDPRLILLVAPAVAKAAMDSGVAKRPIEDFDAYTRQLSSHVFRSGTLMQPIFARAKQASKRVIFAEGEDDRVLQAAQVIVDENLASPVLIGRPAVVENRLKRLGLRLEAGRHFELINPEDDPRFRDYWTLYHSLMERRGVSPDEARTIVRTNTTIIGALAVKRGDADALICGAVGRYSAHLRHVLQVIGAAKNVCAVSSLAILVLDRGTFFLSDPFVAPDPAAEEIAEATLLAAEKIRHFGIHPRAALLSHSNFGSSRRESARKMRRALKLIRAADPELEVEGEMHGDAAISPEVCARLFPNSKLTGPANLLVMPTLDAANITFELLKTLADGLPVGPLLLGLDKPAHIVASSVTARGIINTSALAVVDAIEANGA